MAAHNHGELLGARPRHVRGPEGRVRAAVMGEVALARRHRTKERALAALRAAAVEEGAPGCGGASGHAGGADGSGGEDEG
jgi:hypothetical protein